MDSRQQGRAQFFNSADADPNAIAGQTVAVLGYGNLGRSVALNLRDSGLNVTIGNVDDDYRSVASADGFTPMDIPEAVSTADIAFVLLPDEVIPACLSNSVAPHIKPGSALCFASGYALAYESVNLPENVDVLLMAPRMVGAEVRRTYQEGTGFFSHISVERDESGKALERLLALTAAVGSLQYGAMRLTAEQEALLDLFVEQSFGAYLGVALQAAFSIGQEAGLPPEALVLELYMSGEMSRTISQFAEKGFFSAVAQHGFTATYGGFLRTLEIDTQDMEQTYRSILDDIVGGGFATRLQQEREQGYPTVTAIREITEGDNDLNAAEEHVRASVAALRNF